VLNNFKTQFQSFPKPFRLLIFTTFIDRLGGGIIFPFLSLYVAQKFGVGMTEVGLIFGVWSASSLVGSMIGGALADKFGRKTVIIFGLLSSATSGILMGLVTNISSFYILALVAGVFSEVGHPASQAMVADLLSVNKRAEGFGILRVVANLAMTLGPVIGGALAGYSYMLLFIIDALASTITALIFLFVIPETKPENTEDQNSQSVLKTIAGYSVVLKDKVFLAFIFASMIILFVYTQMYSTLSVFLNQVHGVSAQEFGWIMSMNAAMVVLFQFWVTRRVKDQQPLLMMILASALYGIGFVLFGFVQTTAFFYIGMALITIGEMVHMPVAQALAAFFAPEDMRGRYMAAYGLGWAIPNIFAPLLAGLVMDNYDPYWVWYLAGILAIAAVLSFWLLFLKTRDRFTHYAAMQD
jgi:MFS family permease